MPHLLKQANVDQLMDRELESDLSQPPFTDNTQRKILLIPTSLERLLPALLEFSFLISVV